ncbi:MAG: hypothetical protein PVG45_06965 [Gammaproteobacteria bacterium]|jgi:hypothetical protein
MADSAKNGAQLLASSVMSLAMFSLAGALIYFAYQVSLVSMQIPQILTSVNQTAEKIEPVVSEVSEIRLLIPDILHEVEQTRKLVPPVLDEVTHTRQQIPPILREVEAVRKEIPAVLESADRASAAVVGASKEIEATRPLVPQVLQEVETTRESIPPLLDRADAMIDKAREAGKEASTGAVTGFFKGIITAPFVLMGDAGKKIMGVSEEEAKQFSSKDFDLLEAASLQLLNNGQVGDVREINNPESGYHAKIKLLSEYTKEEDFEVYDCRIIQVESDKEGMDMKTVKKSLCKNDQGKWDFDD